MQTLNKEYKITIASRIVEVAVGAVIMMVLGFYVQNVTDKNIKKVAQTDIPAESQEERSVNAPAPAKSESAVSNQLRYLSATPDVKGNLTVAAPIKSVRIAGSNQVISMDKPENCLAVNAYFEARNQSDIGAEWTMWTVRNRVGRYHNETVCDAVLNAKADVEGRLLKDKSHYSWTTDNKQELILGKTNEDMKRWNQSYKIAVSVMSKDKGYDPTHGATHYVKVGTKADWIKNMDKKVARLDDHIFYQGW
jgi:spore germination cell wall hydrolase CwlJ-like protein